MSDVRFGSWSVAESPVTVEYSLVLIEEIRHEVAEGFQRLARGGMEVGGVLYGTRDGRTVSLLAMRPITCEHARGPALLLSDADRATLRTQIRDDEMDPRLEGMICLGWFLSHTKSEIMLTASDLEIFSEFFGAPWQVTLVVRPGRGGSMRAGFFVREVDGAIHSEASYQEFNFPDRLAGVLDRQPRERGTERSRPHVFARNDGSAVSVPLRREREVSRPFSQLPMENPDLLPEPAPRSKWPWLVGWAVVVIILAVLGIRYFMPKQAPEPIALTVAEHDGQLRIEWNKAARPIAGAAHGTLDIVDGKDTRTVALTPQDLARGSFAYERKSGDIEVRLSVESPVGDKTQEASRYLGRPVDRVNPNEVRDLQQQRDDLQQQVDKLTEENQTQSERIQELERTLRIMQARGR
jgi:hypothetical protein